MKSWLCFSQVVAATVVGAFLAGCGSPQAFALGTPSTIGSAQFVPPPSGAVTAGGAIHRDRGRSWMLPAAMACAYNGKLPPCGLLYVTNYYDDDVLVFKNSKLVGTLTGFNGPDGACTDQSGNVWITNNLGQDLVEYAHGGTTPLKTLDDSGNYPLGCAVNPRTGAVVVANIFTLASGPGSIAIYHKAGGPAEVLTDPDIYYVYFCAFDVASNLYIDGVDAQGNFKFAELLPGSHKFRNIALDGTIYFPGAVKWDGKYVDVGDQMYQNKVASAVYQTTGSGGEIVGTTVFTGAQDVVGYDVKDTNVIGPDANLNVVSLYEYPAGGDPTAKLSGFKHPYGVAISVER